MSRSLGEESPLKDAAPLRVLMFNTQFHPVVGGAERQLELISRVLVEAGVRVTVLTFRSQKSWALRETRDGYEIVRIPHFRAHNAGAYPRWARVLALIQGVRLAAAVARLAPRFDVLHAHNASTPHTGIAVRVARAFGLGTVVKTVNSGEWFDLARLEADSAFGARVRRWLIADVDRWVAVSAKVAEHLLAYSIPDEKVVRLPNGVDTEVKRAEIPERALHFLHVGRLARTAPRDVAGMLRAFVSIEAGAVAPQLLVVGGGDRLEELRTLAANSSARERIRLVGEQESRPWMQWGHVLVHPSFSEGMSNALLEGMAAGLACVAYDIPPNREALDDGRAGELVPVGDVESLADRLTRLAREPARARRFGELARERAVAEFRIERIRDGLLAIYSEISRPKSWRRIERRRAHVRDLRLFEARQVLPLLPRGGSLLEIGAGAGWQAKSFAAEGFSVTAIDVPGSADSSPSHLPIIQYDGQALPFRTQTFDVVFSSNVLEHVRDLPALQREIRRVLRPGGVIVHVLPTPAWRIWSAITYYVALGREVRTSLGNAIGRRSGRAASPGARPEDRRRLSWRWLSYLAPRRHGKVGSWLGEIYLFSRRRWVREFSQAGFAVRDSFATGLFYTGETVFGDRLTLSARRRLARVLGSAGRIYVLGIGGGESRRPTR